MPDGQYNFEDEEQDGTARRPGSASQFGTEQDQKLPSSNSMPMPRKAIPRKQPAPSFIEEEEAQTDLDYGVHEELDGLSGYQAYAPAPSKTALRKKAAAGKEKLDSGGSTGENPLMTALFQIASIMPGMRLEDRSVKPKERPSDNGFRSPPDIRTNTGPRPIQSDGPRPGGTVNRKSALEDLAKNFGDSGGGGGGGGNRHDIGSLEQSAFEKFIEKVFGSSNDIAPVQEVEAPAVKQKKFFIRMGVLISVAIVLAIGYSAVPRQTQLYDNFPREFWSAEHEKGLKLMDSSTAQFQIGTDIVKTPVKFFLNDPRDFIDVIALSPFQKQLFLAKTEHGIKDIDSNFELFEERAPESVLANEAQKTAERVEAYFQKNHSYPTTAEGVGKYFNPYDEKEHLVVFKQITEGNTKSGEDIEQKKLDLYKELVFSKSKMEPEKPEPGTISCFNVKFVAAHQLLNVFIIKPFGKNGAPVIGGHTDAQFFIALEDGQPKELLAVKPLFEWIGKTGIRPLTAIICATQLDGFMLMILKHSAKLVLTLMAFGSLGFLLSLKKGDSPIFWIVMLVITTIPAILADFSNFIP